MATRTRVVKTTHFRPHAPKSGIPVGPKLQLAAATSI